VKVVEKTPQGINGIADFNEEVSLKTTTLRQIRLTVEDRSPGKLKDYRFVHLASQVTYANDGEERLVKVNQASSPNGDILEVYVQSAK